MPGVIVAPVTSPRRASDGTDTDAAGPTARMRSPSTTIVPRWTTLSAPAVIVTSRALTDAILPVGLARGSTTDSSANGCATSVDRDGAAPSATDARYSLFVSTQLTVFESNQDTYLPPPVASRMSGTCGVSKLRSTGCAVNCGNAATMIWSLRTKATRRPSGDGTTSSMATNRRWPRRSVPSSRTEYNVDRFASPACAPRDHCE